MKTPIGLFNIYYDQFKFPFTSYYSVLPATGNEFLINYSTSLFKGFFTTLKYKSEVKDVNTEVGESIKIYKICQYFKLI